MVWFCKNEYKYNIDSIYGSISRSCEYQLYGSSFQEIIREKGTGDFKLSIEESTSFFDLLNVKVPIKNTQVYSDKISQGYVVNALSLIQKKNPEFLNIYKSINAKTIFLDDVSSSSKKYGFSSPKAPSLIFTSIQSSDYGHVKEFALALDLVHELAHQVIFLYQRYNQIFKNKKKSMIYSPLKKCDRPADLALHGLCALTYMTMFIENYFESQDLSFLEKEIIQDECPYVYAIIDDFFLALSVMLKHRSKLTTFGSEILDEIEYVSNNLFKIKELIA